jgi:hypothetical protein
MVDDGGVLHRRGRPWRLGCGCGTAGMWRSPARLEENEGERDPVVRERRGVAGLVGQGGGLDGLGQPAGQGQGSGQAGWAEWAEF